MTMETATEAAQYIGGICAAAATILLKHLHSKVQNAVSKAELATAQADSKADLAQALLQLANQRMEDMQRAEIWRRERRETENEIFQRLGIQDKILARIDERTARSMP